MPAEDDWKSSITTDDHPTWLPKAAQYRLIEAQRLGAEKQARGRYGLSPTEFKKAFEELRKRPEYSPTGDITYPVQFSARQQPAYLTVQDIIQLESNPAVAKEFYARATEIPNPPKIMVDDFIQRLKTTYPPDQILAKYEQDLRSPEFKSPEMAQDISKDAIRTHVKGLDKGAVEQKLRDLQLPVQVAESSSTMIPSGGVFSGEIQRLIPPTQQAIAGVEEANRKALRQALKKDPTSIASEAVVKQQLKQFHPLGAQARIDALSKEAANAELSALTKTRSQIQEGIKSGAIKSAADLPGGILPSIAQPAIDYFANKAAIEASIPQKKAAVQLPYDEAKRIEGLQRLGFIKKADELMAQSATIAPFNRHHDLAEAAVQEAGDKTRQWSDAREQRLAALREEPDISEGLNRELGSRAPALEHLSEEGIQKHRSRQFRQIIKDMKEEAEEEWNKRIAPRVAGSYAVMGAQHSGAYPKAMAEARAEHLKKVNREIMKMSEHADEVALQRALAISQAQHSQGLERGQTRVNTAKLSREDRRALEESTSRQQQLDQAQRAVNITAEGQLAQQQQLQEQHMRDAQRAEWERPVRERQAHQVHENAMAMGINPSAVTNLLVPEQAPAPPSGPALLSSMLGAMAGFPQQQQGMAHGGHAKRKFAGGGLIPSWQELSMQVRPDKYAPQQEKIAEQLQTYNSPFNPMQNWMQHVSAQQLQNLSGDPLAAMGRGAQLAHADQLKYQQHAYDQSRMDKIQAANLYDKMNDSLRHQQHFLADYEAKKAHHLETQRHHGAIEGHSAQALAMKAQKYAMQNQQDFDGMEGEDPYIASMQRKASQLKPTQQKAADEAFKELELGEEVAEKAELGKQLYGKVSTGPIIGHLHPSLASIFGKGSVADRDLAQQLSNDLALQTSQMAKGRGSNMQLGLIQSVKGASTNTPERNLLSMKAIKNKGKDTSHVARQRLYRLGFSKKEIDAYLAGRPKTTLEDPTVPAKGDHKSHANDLSSMSNEELMRIASGG